MVLTTSACLRAADDPFTIDAATNFGPIQSAAGSGENLVDLVEDLIKTQNQFSSLSLRSFDATLRYGDLNNAVRFSRNATGTSATVTFPTTGYSRTFTAANPDDLEEQIRDFFKDEGADEYANFLRTINERTTIGVADGNPLATTALVADRGFARHGFRPTRFDLAPNMSALRPGFEVDVSGGAANSDDADGYFAGIGLGSTFGFNDRVGLSIDGDFRYRDVDGASVYQVASSIGLPIVIVPPRGDRTISWRFTPAFVSGFGGSWDLAAGGILLGGQFTSSLSYQLDGWIFTLANQFGFYEGVPIDISDFRFETDVSQQILKNGVQVTRALGDAAFVDASVSYTNFLEDAAVDGYLSPGVGAGIRFGQASGIRVAYHADLGDGFTVHAGQVELFFAY